MIDKAVLAILSLTIGASLCLGQEIEPISPENAPTWEKEMAKNFLPHHKLTILDFPVKRSGTNNMAFMLQPFLHTYYGTKTMTTQQGFVYCYITDWKVFSGFDRNASWRNPKADMKSLLPYAQALLDLVEVESRQFGGLKEGELPSGQGASVEEAQFRLRDSLAAFNHKQFWEMQKELEKFVADTKNGQDSKKVAKLGAEIKKRLDETPVTNPHPVIGNSKQ